MRPHAAFAAGALLLGAAFPSAAEFGVAPLRVELTPSMKSAVVSITGKTTAGRLLQVSAMRWTQDAEGRDVYDETTDLVFLPKAIDLSKSPKQLIRVGTEKPVT